MFNNGTLHRLIAAMVFIFPFFVNGNTLAQGTMSLSTVSANNGQTGVSFDIQATKSTKLHRFWVETNAGSNTIEIWANPDGMFISPGVARTTGWYKLGEATFNAAGSPAYNEIPFTLDLMMDPGDKWGFILWRTNGSLRYRTGAAPYVFSDSYISINTQGFGVSGSWPNPSFGFYPRQFCGKVTYDEGCFFPEGMASYELLDAALQPTGYVSIPGSINLKYNVTFPDEETSVGITMNLRNVATDAIVFSHSFSKLKPAGQSLVGFENIPLPGTLRTGYFKVEVVFNTKNSCMDYANLYAAPSTLLLLPSGATMCIVWPGDTDNDGIVNYADRKALHGYILESNLRSDWLTGPSRFSIVGGFDYLRWAAQPSAPWNTPNGCYMDTDGNGVIDNYDYLAIKLNWMRTNAGNGSKSDPQLLPSSFDMEQNFPNPFNPSTTIRYAAPEASFVRLEVHDLLGRTVRTLADGLIKAGVHLATFDAAGLPSGNYLAFITITGIESDVSYSSTIKMTLNK